jgi:hypothetical protein
VGGRCSVLITAVTHFVIALCVSFMRHYYFVYGHGKASFAPSPGENLGLEVKLCRNAILLSPTNHTKMLKCCCFC